MIEQGRVDVTLEEAFGTRGATLIRIDSCSSHWPALAFTAPSKERYAAAGLFWLSLPISRVPCQTSIA